MKLSVGEIAVGEGRRASKPESLGGMVDSLQSIGQLYPILVQRVDDGFVLVDGGLRLAAAKQLGWTEVEVQVVDLDEIHTELAELDSNLIGQELTELERDEALLRRKELYEALYPEVRYASPEMMRGVRQGDTESPRPPSFADASASLMGCDARTVQRAVKIVTGLPQDVRDLVRSTPVADRQGDLDRLSRCPEAEQRRIAQQLASGELERVPKDAGRRPTWTPPDPETVLVRAERALTRYISGRPDADVAVIPEAIREIELARSAWTPSGDDDEADVPPTLSLDDIDSLPAGQLEVRWLGSHVQVLKAGTVVAHVPVRRAKRSDKSFINGSGNSKTRGWMGMLNSCSHGCLRRAVGFPGTDLSCYTGPDGNGGCYCWSFACNQRAEFQGSDVTANGLVNDILRITLPADGDASLGDLIPKGRKDGVMTWRVDCESSTGDLSIALGLLQVWCETNPDQSFATICSDHFRPSDAMLAWLAALDNVVVGHSVSAWFSPEELESRFAAIERFLEWGIPTVIWVVTDPDWDNGPVAERATALVGKDHIIEEPHRRGQSKQCPPVLHVNPAGPCSANRHDGKERNLEFVSSADGGPDDYMVRLDDGTIEQPSGGVHSRCKGCTIRCGLAAHGKLERPEHKPSGVPTRRGPHTPFPTTDQQSYEVVGGDVREHLRTLGERQVHCVLTSPPYYGIKTYGHSPLEIGHERTPQEYIETLCDVFDAIPLHPLGSCWVNLRDRRQDRVLLGIPERFIIAMQDRGWKLLDRVVWAKSALLPDGTTHGEVTTERVPWRLNGNGWEYVLRFSRTDEPWYDPCAHLIPRQQGDGERYSDRMVLPTVLDGRIPPDVWLFGPDRTGRPHVAPMLPIVCEIPIALTCPLWVHPDGSLPVRLTETVEYDDGRAPRRMGKYAQPDLLVEGGLGRRDTGSIYVPRKPESLGWTDIAVGAQPGTVYDPFAGSGTTGIVALQLGRSFLGCELDEGSAHRARQDLSRTLLRLSGHLRPEADRCEQAPVRITWDESDDLAEVAVGGAL